MNTIIVDGMAFAMPLFIIAVGGIYSERSGVTNLALEGFLGAGGFFGALFVVKPTFTAASLPALAGVLSGASAGFAYSCVRVLGAKGERGLMTVFFFSAFSTLVALPFFVAFYEPMTPFQWFSLIMAGVSATGGQFCITAGALCRRPRLLLPRSGARRLKHRRVRRHHRRGRGKTARLPTPCKKTRRSRNGRTDAAARIARGSAAGKPARGTGQKPARGMTSSKGQTAAIHFSRISPCLLPENVVTWYARKGSEISHRKEGVCPNRKSPTAI